MKPHISTALINARAAGHKVIQSHVLPDGSVLYRLSNFNILKCKPCGESLGRLSTDDWDAAKQGRLGG